METPLNSVQEAHLNHVTQLRWIREMDKLRDSQPPYDCDDDEAIKRFEGVLKSCEKRARLRLQNRNQYEEA